jgi:ribulose-5-phosphate 4-epimerase/fuculose-1-phosphate aldolase
MSARISQGASMTGTTSMRTAALVLVFVFAMAGRAGTETAPAPAPADAAVIEDLVLASRILANEGVLDAYGHVSIRHPKDTNRYLMARSLAPALIAAKDILEFDLDSNPISPTQQRLFTERFIHGAIYKLRPDVMAIVHSHSPGVIPFGISSVPLRPVFHLGAFLYPGVPVFEIRDAGGVTDMLVRDNNLGDALANTLGDKHVVLMRGHGDVVVGPSIQHAVFRAIYTEVNARLQTQALALGGTIKYLSPEEGDMITNVRPGNIGRAWDLWKSKLAGK